MPKELRGRKDKRWRDGSAPVEGRKADDSVGLYSLEGKRILERMNIICEQAEIWRASLICGARSGNPEASAILQERFRCKVYTREEIDRYACHLTR